jgi:copper chaperone NosL
MIAFATIALVLGCARGTEPDDPVWGKEPCAHCRMVLSDERYAAELIDEAGTRYHFDDVGCMIAFAAERGLKGKAWVRDPSGARWTDAEHARYVGGARTPMGYGFSPAKEGTMDLAQVRSAVLGRKGATS